MGKYYKDYTRSSGRILYQRSRRRIYVRTCLVCRQSVYKPLSTASSIHLFTFYTCVCVAKNFECIERQVGKQNTKSISV